ncbi:MAG: guanylate kinase [Patescibacteria group bacterium]|jgi:guanylate kinase
MKSNKIFIMAGPSAVGKNAIIAGLLKSDLPLQRMITTTSRPPRSGDSPNDYHFVSREQFMAWVAEDKMIEWVEYNQNLYGTRKQDLEDIFTAGKFPIMDIDVRGVASFKQLFPNVVAIFILPSSLSILRQRLEARGTAEHDIRERLKTAQSEIELAPSFDYRITNYNGKLANVVKDAATIVQHELAG